MTKRANKTETAIANDEAELRSITTGEVLKEKGLCPLVIVRTAMSGVHIGYLASVHERTVILLEARNLWRWRGANTLKEVASKGVEQEFTRISEPVEQLAIFAVDEIMCVTHDAAPSLLKSRWGV